MNSEEFDKIFGPESTCCNIKADPNEFNHIIDSARWYCNSDGDIPPMTFLIDYDLTKENVIEFEQKFKGYTVIQFKSRGCYYCGVERKD